MTTLSIATSDAYEPASAAVCLKESDTFGPTADAGSEMCNSHPFVHTVSALLMPVVMLATLLVAPESTSTVALEGVVVSV
jgi:hypothetical protein